MVKTLTDKEALSMFCDFVFKFLRTLQHLQKIDLFFRNF